MSSQRNVRVLRHSFAAALLFLPLTACFGVCQCDNPLPDDPDTCSDPASTANLSQIQLLDPEEPYEILDGSEWRIVIGGQGAPMRGLRVRVQGENLPECLDVEIAYLPCDTDSWYILHGAPPLKFHGNDNERTSDEVWEIFNYEPTCARRLRVTTLGQVREVDLAGSFPGPMMDGGI